MTPKLTIIVPVYDVEAYLSRCLDSILAQTFTDFEAILIDDGSPDNCGAIIDEYAKKDARFVAIHQQNKGVSAARNVGLRIAKGEYIGFVDPDDWIEPDMYETLICETEKNDCDLAVCSWMDNKENGEVLYQQNSLKRQIVDRDTFGQHLFDMPPTVMGSVCNKLFKREHIKEPFESAHRICEDNVFVAEYVCRINKAAITDRPLYHMFSRQSSATRQIPERVALGLSARRQIVSIAGRISEKCRMRAERVYLDQCMTYCGAHRDKTTPYYQLAGRELVSYIMQHLWRILCNSEMTIGFKAVLLKHYFRIKAEKQ